MKQLQKGLQSAIKALNALATKIDAISKKLEVFDKAKSTPKSPIKSMKKGTPKKVAVPTASETVLKVINRSKKGVNTAALIEKTGFNTKKIRNVVFRLKKQGKIKSPKKGVYAKA